MFQVVVHDDLKIFDRDKAVQIGHYSCDVGDCLARHINILHMCGTFGHTLGELVYFGYGVGRELDPNREQINTVLRRDLELAQDIFVLYHKKAVIGHIAFGNLPSVDIPYITGFVVSEGHRHLETGLLKFAIQNLEISSFFGHTNRPAMINLLGDFSREGEWAGAFGIFQLARYPMATEGNLAVTCDKAIKTSFPKDTALGAGFLGKPYDYLPPLKQQDLIKVSYGRALPAFCTILRMQQIYPDRTIVAPFVMIKEV